MCVWVCVRECVCVCAYMCLCVCQIMSACPHLRPPLLCARPRPFYERGGGGGAYINGQEDLPPPHLTPSFSLSNHPSPGSLAHPAMAGTLPVHLTTTASQTLVFIVCHRHTLGQHTPREGLGQTSWGAGGGGAWGDRGGG